MAPTPSTRTLVSYLLAWTEGAQTAAARGAPPPFDLVH